MRSAACAALVFVALMAARGAPAQDKPEPARSIGTFYDVRVVPSEKAAYVKITLGKNASAAKLISFRIDPERHLDFEGDGKLELEAGRVHWRPPQKGGTLSYTFRIDRLRGEQERYDARITSTWGIFRGDHLIPFADVDFEEGAGTDARLRLRLPEGWKVASRFATADDGTLIIDTPQYAFDRPTGWFIIGKLAISRSTVAGSNVTVAAPYKQAGRNQDLLAFLRYTLPELKSMAGELPASILIVTAGDPMWRGGLSGPFSLYLHNERPLILKDFTSPVLHEIVHATMRARAGEDGDWIVEGFADLYSLETLHRTKGISAMRYRRGLEKAAERGKDVARLRVPKADHAVTARAVTVLKHLADEMNERCEAGLDDVFKRLVAAPQAMSTAGFIAIAQDVGSCDLSAFFSHHLADKVGSSAEGKEGPRQHSSSRAAAVP
jgi:hypothetical protein